MAHLLKHHLNHVILRSHLPHFSFQSTRHWHFESPDWFLSRLTLATILHKALGDASWLHRDSLAYGMISNIRECLAFEC